MIYSCEHGTLTLHLQPIHEVIGRDDETKKIQNVISAGMQANAQNLQAYLATWDNYREIWEIQKDAFIRRYQKLNPQVSSFDADIGRYRDMGSIKKTCFKFSCAFLLYFNKAVDFSFTYDNFSPPHSSADLGFWVM